LRRIRPRLTVAEATAILSIVLFLFTSAAGNAANEMHDRPVPILMYHVIAPAPPGVAFPELFVEPKDFAEQMHWLVEHGFHAVTLHRVYEYWLRGTRLPPHPIVISFDDGTIGQDTHALPVLRSLHWPAVLNLKLNALRARYTLSPWRVRQMLAAGWELDSHTITHPDLTHVDDAQLWREVYAVVRAAGYLGATTTRYGLARPEDIYTLARIRIDGTDHLAGFANKLSSLTR
jgi:peptidoglycan/xylan/chitin deacetylase (PgdA/CDA1 family)